MYLSRIHIRNFRCFDQQGIEVEFRPGINVVIGENNTGKSALMDALRLAFSLGSGRREIYVTPQDFHVDRQGRSAEEMAFDLTFSDLTESEESGFYEMLVVDSPMMVQLHVRYKRETLEGARERIRVTFWGGEKEGQSIPTQSLELINHIFLGALRDAERDLRPGRGSRLGQLVRNLIPEGEGRERVLSHVRTANRAILKDAGIRQASDIINNNLNEIEGARLRQNVQVGFVPPDFGRIVDSLRPLLPPREDLGVWAAFSEDEWNDLLSGCPGASAILQTQAQSADGRLLVDLAQISEGDRQRIGEETYDVLQEHIVGVFGLEQNGMGYNNIIYMGASLGDLQQWKNVAADSYNALLIEEPEAHLHPQLQDLVFDFLGRVSAAEAAIEGAEEAEVAASDAAEMEATGTEELEITEVEATEAEPVEAEEIEESDGKVQVFITSHSPTLTSRAPLDSLIMLSRQTSKIVALPLGRCPLTPTQSADLTRYLDVTKAQLFFAKGVVLVEGISEALLLPAFALRLERRLDYNAVEVVNVGGTAFEPFARLFNSEDLGQRVDVPCVILTDDDRCTSKEDSYRLTDQDLELSFVGANDITEMQAIIEKLDGIRRKLQQGTECGRSKKARDLESGSVIVKVAYKTFEYELARIPGNTDAMLEALEDSHPRITKGLRSLFEQDRLDDEGKAICLWLATRDVKAEFAQRLSALLCEYDGNAEGFKQQFTVPGYIADALKYVAPVKTPLHSGEQEGDVEDALG